MYKIDWSNHNGESFQSFCNDILDFELGVNYVPFIAPGSDGGIDGLFDGEYGKFSGKWRIQAKYCAPETGRQKNIDRLAQELKLELKKLSSSESNHFILITNVEIGPKQLKKLLSISDQVQNNLELQTLVHIWDDAKISTILSHHPILLSKYLDEYDSELVEYRDYFSKQLTNEVQLVNQMGNTFYFREAKIKELNEFLKNEHTHVSCVSGSAGIGKTRFVVEFFDQLRNIDSNWLPLVLSATGFDAVRLQKNLRGKRDYIVLLDDVDRFDLRSLESIIELSKLSKNKVKFVFTVRLSLLDSFLDSLSIRNKGQISRVELEKFTPEETWEVLTSELKSHSLERYKNSFIQITNGVPIVIVLLIDTIRSAKSLDSIKDDDFLREYVFNHFNKIAQIAKNEFDVRKNDFNKFLNIYALIEPINLDDEQIQEFISKTEGIEINQVIDLFQYFEKEKIVIGRGNKLIKPDLYSDFILSRALRKNGWLKKKLTEYDSFIHNMVLNLGYLYHNRDTNIKGTINSILKEFIDQIDTVESSKKLSQILDVTRFLSNVEEEHAKNALSKVLIIYSNDNHKLNKELLSHLGKNSYSAYLPFIQDIKGILRSLFHSEYNWKSSVQYSEKFYALIGDNQFIENIARYGNEDLYNGFNCRIQSRIPRYIGELLAENQKIQLFHFKLLKFLLKLETTDTSGDPVNRHSLIIRTIYVPDNKNVRVLRFTIIDLLIKLFDSDNIDDELKNDIFIAISDIPREILSVKDKAKFEGVELTTVLDFIDQVSLSDYLPLKSKHKLKETLYWYKQWGIEKKYHSKINAIQDHLEGDSLEEELMDLLNPNSKYFEVKETIDSDAQKIILRYNPSEITKALIHVIAQSDSYPHYLQQFINILAGDLAYATELLEEVWKLKRELLFTHFATLFGVLRFSIDGENKYWDFISRFEGLNTTQSRNAVLSVYTTRYLVTYYGGNNPELKEKDVELLLRVIESSKEENYYQLSNSLPTLLLMDEDLAKTEIRKFLSKCNYNHLDYLFLSLEPFYVSHNEFIRDLIFNETIQFNLSYRLEKLIAELINNTGFSDVLKYFEKRFLYRRDLVNKNKHSGEYDFFPKHNGGTLMENIDPDLRIAAFKDTLDWFLTFKFEPYESYWAISILEEFTPNGEFTFELKNHFAEIAGEFISNFEKFVLAIEALKIFKRKNSDYVYLILLFYLKSEESLFSHDQKKIIQTQLYIAFTAVGVKMGTAGQPFGVDIELKELIQSAIMKNEFKSEKLVSFLKAVLESVERDIQQNTDNEDDVW